MQGWSATDFALVSPPIAGVVANSPVSREISITAGGSRNNKVKLVVSGVTVVGSITAKFQSAIGDDWVDAKTVTVTGNGNFYISHNIEVTGDQGFLPLLNKGRVVITTTNAGDAVTVANVYFLQELQKLVDQTSRWCKNCSSYHLLSSENWLEVKSEGLVKLRCRVQERERTRRWRVTNPSKIRECNYRQKRKPTTKYSELKSNALKRGLEVTISLEALTALIVQPCDYCGSVESIGVDRIDNSLGYIPINCISCCYMCNITRNNLYTYEEFKTYIVPGIIKVRNERQKFTGNSDSAEEIRAFETSRGVQIGRAHV